MKEYRVTWQIELIADNPTEAAMNARILMLDPYSEAVHFTVGEFRPEGVTSTVDVDLIDVDFSEAHINT